MTGHDTLGRRLYGMPARPTGLWQRDGVDVDPPSTQSGPSACRFARRKAVLDRRTTGLLFKQGRRNYKTTAWRVVDLARVARSNARTRLQIVETQTRTAIDHGRGLRTHSCLASRLRLMAWSALGTHPATLTVALLLLLGRERQLNRLRRASPCDHGERPWRTAIDAPRR